VGRGAHRSSQNQSQQATDPGRQNLATLSPALEGGALLAWLHNFRRLVTRWEYYENNFLGMVQLACILILLRRYL